MTLFFHMTLDLPKIAHLLIRSEYIHIKMGKNCLPGNIVHNLTVNIMRKFLSVIAIVTVFAAVLPSCSQSDDFDEIVVNQIDEQESDTGSGSDVDNGTGGEKPGNN